MIRLLIVLLALASSPGVLGRKLTPSEIKSRYKIPPQNDKEYLLDISDDTETQPEPGLAIFFHETSHLTERLHLNLRQSCAIESALKWNPDRTVFVLFAAPRFQDGNEESHVKALASYPNLVFRNADLWRYANNTPLGKWMSTNAIFHSKYVVSHISDLMRFLSLYKFQGTYLDLDVIVLQLLNKVSNYATAESPKDVAVGLMNFNATPKGKMFATKCLKDYREHYSGKAWGTNGPGVMTRVLRKVCGTNKTAKMTPSRCKGFLVLPPTTAYAVPYTFKRWKMFFEPPNTQKVFKLLKNSVVAHFWNALSMKIPVQKGSGSAYDLLAKVNCPRVYETAPEYF